MLCGHKRRVVRCFWHLVKLPSVAVKTFVLLLLWLPLPLFGSLAIFIACGADIKHFRRSIENCCTYFDYAMLQLVISVLLLNIARVLCRSCRVIAAITGLRHAGRDYVPVFMVYKLWLNEIRAYLSKGFLAWNPLAAVYLISKQQQFYGNVKHIQRLLIQFVVNYFNCTKEYGIIGSSAARIDKCNNTTHWPAITN